MCVSMHPAKLTRTTLMGHTATVKGHTRHVVGYQNTVQNNYDGANAMVLPIPAASPMTPWCFLGTNHARHMFTDMLAAVTPTYRGGSRGMMGGAAKGLQVFSHGVYTIALGTDVTEQALAEALERVPEDRRPELNWDVLGAYPELYPGWTLAFCCFNNAEAREAAPLVYHYDPMDPTQLFLPALDGHDGRRPRLGTPVEVDHTVFVGSSAGAPVAYQDDLGRLSDYLPQQVLCARLDGVLPNGDFAVDLDNLATGAASLTRTSSGHANTARTFRLRHEIF